MQQWPNFLPLKTLEFVPQGFDLQVCPDLPETRFFRLHTEIRLWFCPLFGVSWFSTERERCECGERRGEWTRTFDGGLDVLERLEALRDLRLGQLPERHLLHVYKTDALKNTTTGTPAPIDVEWHSGVKSARGSCTSVVLLKRRTTELVSVGQSQNRLEELPSFE